MVAAMFDLGGRVALVTGGNGGIGLGIAEGLAGAGAAVVLAARDEAKTADAVKGIAGAGGRASGVRCDVRRREDVEGAVAAALERHARLDVLVANAGIPRSGRPEEMSEQDWSDVIDTNLSAVFRCCQVAHPHLVASGHGSIITVASEYSLFGSPRVVAYSASKGGVVQLTKSLAAAWATQGVRVNAILPGWIWTGMTEALHTDAGAPLRDAILARTPMGRFGEPPELAGAAVFLASDAAGFVTGQTLAVDGGYSIA